MESKLFYVFVKHPYFDGSFHNRLVAGVRMSDTPGTQDVETRVYQTPSIMKAFDKTRSIKEMIEKSEHTFPRVFPRLEDPGKEVELFQVIYRDPPV